MPAVNQIEVNPYFSNDPLRAFAGEHGILTEAWSPLAQGAVLGEPALLQVAERLGVTAAAVFEQSLELLKRTKEGDPS